MIVAHNLAAINAGRQFHTVEQKKKKAVERLSSGLRVNSAADDAAGLAISEKMRSQIRGLARGAENIQNGISYCQVADGALNEVHAILHRINELAVQAANDTNTSADREAIDREVLLLQDEMDDIFTQTTFNTRRIWEAKMVPVTTTIVQETVHESYPAVVFGKISSASYTDNNNKLAMPNSRFIVDADDDGILVSWTGYDGRKYESERIAWDATMAGSHSFKLSDHMDYTKYPETAGIDFTYTYTVNDLTTKDQLLQAFHESTSNVSNYIHNGVTTKITYANNSSPKILSISSSIDYDAMLASGKNFEAYDTDFCEPASMNNPAHAGVDDASAFSMTFTMPGIGLVKTKLSTAYYTGSYSNDMSDRTGENTWWKENTLSNGSKYKSSISYSIQNSLNGILTAINNTNGHSLWTDNTKGGTICLNFSLVSDTAYTCANGGTTTSVGTLHMNIPVNKNAATSQSDMENYIREAMANLVSIDISDDDTKVKGYSSIYRFSDENSRTKATKSTVVTREEHTYELDHTCDVYIQSGANSGQGVHMTYENLNTERLGIRGANVLTHEAATETMEKVKKALEKVSKQRSVIGAYQNRLEHAEQVNRNAEENTTAAESRIRDADMSAEVVEQSKQNILSQLGISMIAQINQSNKDVLSLLQ